MAIIKEDKNNLPLFGVQASFAINVIKSLIRNQKGSRSSRENQKAKRPVAK
jgi:hypothetical protein